MVPSQMMCTGVLRELLMWLIGVIHRLVYFYCVLQFYFWLHYMYFDLFLSTSWSCFNCNSSCILKRVGRHNWFGIHCLYLILFLFIVESFSLCFPFLQLFLESPQIYSFVNKTTNYYNSYSFSVFHPHHCEPSGQAIFHQGRGKIHDIYMSRDQNKFLPIILDLENIPYIWQEITQSGSSDLPLTSYCWYDISSIMAAWAYPKFYKREDPLFTFRRVCWQSYWIHILSSQVKKAPILF